MKRYGICCAFVLMMMPNISPIETETDYIDLLNEAFMDTDDLKFMNGYPIEKHSVETKDGYKLVVHRIPRAKNATSLSKPTGVPILIMNSLFCNSLAWIDNLDDSLGFILANQLFDVWLGNVRGNEGSSHKSYSRSEANFWDFSWEDMAEYDVPAIIDYITNVTSYKKILYVGHSLGSLIGFALFSSKPEFNNKVAGFASLGPILSCHYTTGLAMKMFANYFDTIQFIYNKLQISEIKFVPSRIKKTSLVISAFTTGMYKHLHATFNGYDSNLLNWTRIPMYSRDGLESTSIKNYEHLVQLHLSQTMYKFDYGKDGNIAKYNTVKPPEYNASNINIPVALFSSANDPLATPIDVQITSRKLRNVIVNEIVSEPMFTNQNFMWLKHPKIILYDRVTYFLKQMWDANGLT